MNVKTGTRVTARGSFADALDAAGDPGSVTVIIRPPSGEVVTLVYPDDPEVVRDDVGQFHVDIDTDAEGRWWVRMVGSQSGPIVAQEGAFDVVSMF